MTAPISQPIFIVGTGRSGSTLFFEIFARHPQVAWLSPLAREYPGRPALNGLLMRALGNRWLDGIRATFLRPSEAYPLWEMACPGFSNPYRDLVAEDVTPDSARRLRETFAGMTTRVRNRFAAKITGWPRLRFLAEVFPDAFFVEITRDLGATASSLLQVPFWDGWRGPSGWRRGPLPGDLDQVWQSENRSFVALAAIECILVHRAMAECRADLGASRIHSVDYGSLCADPVGVLRRVAEHCRLPWSQRFARAVARTRVVNRDDAWRSRLTTSQQAVLERTFAQAGIRAGTGP